MAVIDQTYVLETLKTDVNIVNCGASLDGYILAATKIVENYIGHSIEQIIVLDELHTVRTGNYGSILISPKQKPLISVESLKFKSAPQGVEFDANLNYINLFKPEGYLEYFGAFPYNVDAFPPRVYEKGSTATISYTAGYATIPEDLQLAVGLVVAELYRKYSESEENGNASGKVSSRRIGDFKETFEKSTQGEYTVITPQVEQILDSYGGGKLSLV